MLEFRLKAYRHWLTMKEPKWAHLKYPTIDFQDIIYYAAPKKKKQLASLDEVDPELLATFNKLGISLEEQKKLSGVAVDAVIDSVSVKTTFSGDPVKTRDHLLLLQRSGSESSRPGETIHGIGCSLYRQLFCCTELSRFQRRFVLLISQRGALPD